MKKQTRPQVTITEPIKRDRWLSTPIEIQDRPEGAQLFYRNQWFKIGLHGLVFVWRKSGEWKRPLEMEEDIKKKILDEINGNNFRSKRNYNLSHKEFLENYREDKNGW